MINELIIGLMLSGSPSDKIVQQDPLIYQVQNKKISWNHPYSQHGWVGRQKTKGHEVYTMWSVFVENGDNLEKLVHYYNKNRPSEEPIMTVKKLYDDNKDEIGPNRNLIKPGMLLTFETHRSRSFYPGEL